MSEIKNDFVTTNHNFKKRKLLSVFGIVITALTLLSTVLFGFLVYSMHILPIKYLIISGAALAALFLITAFLCSNCRKRVRFVIGLTLGILITALMIFGSYITAKTMNTISGGLFSDTTTQISRIGVYVLKDDPATDLEDLKQYNFGILSAIDRENTDQTVIRLEDELESKISISEFDSIAEMINGLTNGSVKAIIINKSYLEIDALADIAAQLREITNLEIENKTDNDTPRGNDKNDDKDKNNTGNGKDTLPEVFTVYISGIDSRVGLIEKSRSDVNILATVNTKTRQILLVSTPRDYYVPLSFTGDQRDKLTHAGMYGIDVSMKTVGMLYDTDVDYSLRVNFSGFEKIVDSIGGISVFSDYDFYSAVSYDEVGKYYHYTYGDNYLYGEAALYFARERKSFPAGDIQRGINQMKVIDAVADKILSPQILTTYSSLLDAVNGCFETTIPYDLISSLVKEQLSDMSPWNIVSYSVNGVGSMEQPYSLGGYYASVIIPDESTVEKAKDLIDQVCNGKKITDPTVEQDN